MAKPTAPPGKDATALMKEYTAENKDELNANAAGSSENEGTEVIQDTNVDTNASSTDTTKDKEKENTATYYPFFYIILVSKIMTIKNNKNYF